MIQISPNNKIRQMQASLEYAGEKFKHLVVVLREGQEIAQVIESPDMWVDVQQDRMKSLGRGDTVSIVSADGSVIADRCMVVRAESGNVWLSKPQRLVELQSVSLFEDAQSRIVPSGTGFQIETKRDGYRDERLFASVEAARQEIARRQPSRV